MRARTALIAAGMAGLILAACAPSGEVPHGGVASARDIFALPHTQTLQDAMRTDRDLGEQRPGYILHFSLTLQGRNPAGLQALLASGKRLPATEVARSFGPDPIQIATVRAVLQRAGITTSWSSGDMVMSATGSSGAVTTLFSTPIHDFQRTDGSRFYAPLRRPRVPAALQPVVDGVTGLDDFAQPMVNAIRSPNGVSPSDMTDFYDMTPLRRAGLDGSGETVVFLEWAMPTSQVLNSFAQTFNLPAFNVTVRQDQSWGPPIDQSADNYYNTAGEAALDIEIVHGLAPGANEVVYAFSDPSQLPTVLQAVVNQEPNAILSSSIFTGNCEADGNGNDIATAMDKIETSKAASGLSIFWAAGDRGAFSCLPDGDPSLNGTKSVSPDSAMTGQTSVGGTYVFLASQGGYFKETAWGEPIESWGGGGGHSMLFARPPWQKAPGLDSSVTGRAIPDVSANADTLSGWDVVSPDPSNPSGVEGPVGGTSAATPCWAAIAALIDEDLAHKSLPSIGFANTALYLFATNPSGLPAPPFHDITSGSNLGYNAGPDWDMATGLGSPDVAALADDFEWYGRTHPTS